VVRRIYDPDTGLVLEDKPLTLCAKHWAASRQRTTRRPIAPGPGAPRPVRG